MEKTSLSLIFGGFVCLITIAVFLGIRLRILKPKKAAMVMFLFPIAFETGVVLLRKGEPLQIFCVGILLSLSMGSATYVFGVLLEKWISKQQ